MGGCSSISHTSDDVAWTKSKSIDSTLKKYGLTLTKQVKLLLLGPGESGKSTIFKQMKILQECGLSNEELTSFIVPVHQNCISQMQVLVRQAVAMKVPFQTEEAMKAAHRFYQFISEDVLTEDVVNAILLLWSDSGIQRVYRDRGKLYSLNDTAEYFFRSDNVNRFNQPNYIPTKDDVLHVRIRSTGIEEALFVFEDYELMMVDVGGQRSERRKWIHLFDNVTAIIFMASLNGYDQILREDVTRNMMDEALDLFIELSESPFFSANAIILFLNKQDLFEQKFLVSPLSAWTRGNYVPIENTPTEGMRHIKDQFLSNARYKPSRVYAHFTIALSTENIKLVIRGVMKMILETVLSVGVGLPM